MSQLLVKSILESRLNTWASTRNPPLRVAWQNVPFSPAQGETYLRAFLLPAETLSQDLAGSHRGYIGVFQVSIVCPISEGAGEAYTIAGELNTQFPMNGRYTSSGVTVQIVSPVSIGPALQDESIFTVPAFFNYRADVI